MVKYFTEDRANLSFMHTQEHGIGARAVNAHNIVRRKDKRRKEDNVRESGRLLPFISMLYILNGNHDPRKVQGLNIALAILFLAGGMFSGWDLLPVGFVFAAVAVVNGANLWYIKKRTYYSQHPFPRDILTQIELWTRTAIRHRMPN
jgi:hypothetical protein